MTATCTHHGCNNPAHRRGLCSTHYQGANPLLITLTPIGDATWMEDALCAGIPTELFYPEGPNAADAALAKRACGMCPVRAECLDTFINEDHGVFAGTSPKERRALRQARRKAAA